MRATHEVQVINWFLTPQPPMLHQGGKDHGSRDIILVSSPPLVYTNVIFVSVNINLIGFLCVVNDQLHKRLQKTTTALYMIIVFLN